MSNGLATFIILKVAQLTWVDTKTLPDRDEFVFIACGESQYSFSAGRWMLLSSRVRTVCSHQYFHPRFSGY